MLEIENFLATQDLTTDELGRVIIDDLNLLELINGAMTGGGDFILSDTACGNSNCIC